MTASVFISYLLANRSYLAASTYREIATLARVRITQRLQAGRADSMLTFDDLYTRCENEIAPR